MIQSGEHVTKKRQNQGKMSQSEANLFAFTTKAQSGVVVTNRPKIRRICHKLGRNQVFTAKRGLRG